MGANQRRRPSVLRKARDHRQRNLISQRPNCLGPFTPGYQDCPTRPKVLQGRAVKPTKEERSSIRKEGRAAYKTKLAESRNAQDVTPSPLDLMEAELSAEDTSRPHPQRPKRPWFPWRDVDNASELPWDGDN